MKKIFSAVCAVLALAMVFGMTSCSKKNTNEFVLGLDDSFPPLGFRDEDNKVVGYALDLAAEVCKRIGKTLRCQPIDWAAKEQELNTGKIDCIWNGFTMTDERRNAMACTPAYLENAQVVVVRGDAGITSLADMAGKVVGIQAGSSAQEAVDAAAEFKSSLKSIVEFSENITALNDLQIGNVDGVVMDEVVAAYNIKQSGRDFVILEESLAPEEYGIAFKKSNTELRDKVWETLKAMEADGTVASISDKWFGENKSVISK